MADKIAMYIRLSEEDYDVKKGLADESNSIKSQRMLLKSYINNHSEFNGWDVVECFDDGRVDKINKRISPIKDEYIEKYFAEKTLNLTGTLDAEKAYRSADTAKEAITNDLSISFKGVMNDEYCRDKETPKGVSYMCEIIEKLQNESAAEATLKNSMEIALTLLKRGKDTISEISLITKLSIDTVKQLAIDNNIADII